MPILETYQLSKTYPSGFFRRNEVTALVDTTLEVQAGEIFGLLGPNGAGKTTFVKILLSIVHPSKGTVQLLGKPVGDVGARSHCGFLPENHHYPGFLTAFETLRFFGGLNGTPARVLTDRARHLLDFVGLKEWTDHKVHKFSKGMQQRLGLAQALLNEPQVLFLDEPTDGVDPVGRKEMRDLFLRLKKEGVTIFLNSHLLSEVELVSDRVAILNKGSLVKVGTLDEVRGGSTAHTLHIDRTLSKDQLDMLHLRPSSVQVDVSGTTLTVATESELNRTIDMLRSWGIAIKGVAQQRATLEDSFIKLIAGEPTA